MTYRPDKSVLDLLAVLSRHAHELGSGIALVGAHARSVWGSLEPAATIDVIAAINPTSEDGEGLPVDGTSFQHLLPSIRWMVRRDEFAGFYEFAIDAAVKVSGWPLPVVPMPLLATMLLAERSEECSERLTVMIMAGDVDPDEFSDSAWEHLGPYAVADVERIIANAEWQAMKMKFQGEGQVH